MQGPAAAPVQQPVDASCLLSASSFAAQHSRVPPSVSFVGELLLHFVTLGRRAYVKVAHCSHRRVIDTKCRTNVVGRSNVLTPIIHIIGKNHVFVSNEWSSLFQWVEFSKGRTRTSPSWAQWSPKKWSKFVPNKSRPCHVCMCVCSAKTINHKQPSFEKKKANSCAR